MVQPQAEVKSFPAEPINPLVSNSEGTYIIGGGVSGDIFLWEVSLHTCFNVVSLTFTLKSVLFCMEFTNA